MQYELTPAAERALIAASGWTDCAEWHDVGAPALLLGLLAEPECRAAEMLEHAGIDAGKVREQWPDLKRKEPTQTPTPPQELLRDASALLDAAMERFAHCPQPVALATEHLLLGLAAASHEVGQWLRGRGVAPDLVEGQIHRLYGHEFGPLPYEPEEPASREEAMPGGVPAPQNAQDHTPTFRVIDAAANRAREALRVVEDYLRFILDDRFLTGRCKTLRHDLTAALQRISSVHRLAARETQADVGTQLTTAGEAVRTDAAGVLAANFARLQESLRSLEEFGKLADPEFAARIKQLRYSSYTVHRAVEITRRSSERLGNARLYVLLDGQASVLELRRLAESLVEAGANVLQLRDKHLPDRELLGRARLLREVTADKAILFVMNDRPDLAVLSRADGVHVGQEELPVKDIRQVVGPDMLVGVSTHSIEQARKAVLDGADYIGVGPTFPSGTKRFERFPGIALLRAVSAEIRLPAFAIGGITCDNVGEVVAAGFARVAVSGAVTKVKDPAAAVRELLAKLAPRA
ncbi:MAG: thiamine phosphate synthase [Thermoguttaceae bacterium]|jgi:thiamine-phosphate pyrophosphorylase|nr:thiamine phosphate synthase [Thermoguttaceae bacterium]